MLKASWEDKKEEGGWSLKGVRYKHSTEENETFFWITIIVLSLCFEDMNTSSYAILSSTVYRPFLKPF